MTFDHAAKTAKLLKERKERREGAIREAYKKMEERVTRANPREFDNLTMDKARRAAFSVYLKQLDDETWRDWMGWCTWRREGDPGEYVHEKIGKKSA